MVFLTICSVQNVQNDRTNIFGLKIYRNTPYGVTSYLCITSWPPWAVDREFFYIFLLFFAVVGSGTHLKSFLDEFRFILARYGVKRTHEEPIRVHFYVF